MISLINYPVGTEFQTTSGERHIITRVKIVQGIKTYTKINLDAYSYNLEATETTEEDLHKFKISSYLINRFEGEDYLCYRCFPNTLSHSCIDCEYEKRLKERKSYYDIGSIVYDPVWKKEYKVISVILALDFSEIDKVELYIKHHFKSSYIPLDELTIGYLSPGSSVISLFNKFKFILLYQLDGFSRLTYFKSTDLTLLNRTGYFLDKKQLSKICELCIYDQDELICKNCITNDIKRHCRRV